MALILLCEDLGIEVTAEGVERETQFSCLAANPALYLQGYLISPPGRRGRSAAGDRRHAAGHA